MNRKELALCFGMVAMVLLSLVALPNTGSESNTMAAGFISSNDKPVETFYVGATSNCKLWECTAYSKTAECKCVE